MLRTSLLGCFFLMFFACQQTAIPSPEEVLADYIQYIHSGDFSAAGALCTPAGAAYVTALEAIMIAVAETPDSSKVDIKSLRCVISNADTIAQCEAVLDDGFETYPESYGLRLRAGQWLVHHEPDAGETTTSEEPRTLDSEN